MSDNTCVECGLFWAKCICIAGPTSPPDAGEKGAIFESEEMELLLNEGMKAFWETWPSFRTWWESTKIDGRPSTLDMVPPEPFENAFDVIWKAGKAAGAGEQATCTYCGRIGAIRAIARQDGEAK